MTESTTSLFYFSPSLHLFAFNSLKMFQITLLPDHTGSLTTTWVASTHFDAGIGFGACMEGTVNCYLGSGSSVGVLEVRRLVTIKPQSNLDTTVSTQNLPFFMNFGKFFEEKSQLITLNLAGDSFMILDPTQLNSPPLTSFIDTQFTGDIVSFEISEAYFQSLHTNNQKFIVKVDILSQAKIASIILDGSSGTIDGVSSSIVILKKTDFMIWTNDSSNISIGNFKEMTVIQNLLTGGFIDHKQGIVFEGSTVYGSVSYISNSIATFNIQNLPCHISCNSCEYNWKFKDPEACEICSINFQKDIAIPVGECNCEVALGKFVDPLTDLCSYCPLKCLTCQNDGLTCLSCRQGMYLYEGNCLLECPSSFFKNEDNKTCQECDFPCLQCEESSQKCTECHPSLFPYNNKCNQSCEKGSFFKFSSQSCSPCDSKCLECQLSLDQCSSCKDPYLLFDSTCMDGCPPGLLKNENGECQECWGRCETCSLRPGPENNSLYGCLTCKGDLVPEGSLDEGNDNCVCPDGFTLDIEGSNPVLSSHNDGEVINCRELSDKEKLDFSLLISQIQFFEKSKTITIKFKEKIKKNTFSNLRFDLKDSLGNPENFKIKPKSIKVDPLNTLKIILAIDQNFSDKIFEISSISKNEIKSSESNRRFSTYPIKVPISYYENKAITAAVQNLGKSISILTIILTIVLSLISFNTAVILIKLFQMIDFILLINVKLPTNVTVFMNFFQSNVLDFFPNILYLEEQESRCDMDMFLKSNGVSCNGLNNIGQLLIEILGFLVVMVIFKVLIIGLEYFLEMREMRKVQDSPKNESLQSLQEINTSENPKPKSRTGCFRKNIRIIKISINQGLFWSILNSMELDLLLGSFTSVKARGLEHPYFFLSNMLLIVLLCMYFYYIRKCLELFFDFSRINQDCSKEKEREFQINCLINENASFFTSLQNYKRGNNMGPLIAAFQTSRDLVFPLVIIFFVAYPIIQIMTIVVLSFFQIVLVLIYNPFSDFGEKLSSVLNSILFILVLFLYIILWGTGDTLSTKQKYDFIGNGIIAIFTILLLSNILIGFCTLGKGIYHIFSQKKKKKNLEKKKINMNKNMSKKKTNSELKKETIESEKSESPGDSMNEKTCLKNRKTRRRRIKPNKIVSSIRNLSELALFKKIEIKKLETLGTFGNRKKRFHRTSKVK